jgi:hypothetical protein
VKRDNRLPKSDGACLENVKNNPEKTKVSLEEMEAAVVVFEECSDKMDTMDFEPSQEKPDTVAEHQEVSKDEVAVEIIGALEDRYGNWHLAVGRCRQPKKWTQGNDVSWKKLAAARRQMTHHAGTARCKDRCHKGPKV